MMGRMPPSYGRSVAIAVFVFALTFSPYAHAADTSAFGINDPFADAIQLWSAVLSSIDSLANQIASALQLHQTLTFTAKPHAAKNLQQPVALAASAALATQSPPEIATTSGSASDASITPQQPQTTGPPEPTSDQTTQSPFVKSAVSGPLAKSPEFSQSQASNQALAATPTSALQAEAGFVTQTQFNAAMSALGRSVRQLLAQSNPNPFPEYVGGDGNNLNPYAAASAIDNLSNVIITNPTITGLTASEIPALNYFPATNTIAVAFGGTGLSAAPTYGQLLLGNGSGGYNLVSTSSLGITGGGGGGTPGGSDTQVQFDSGGSFAGSSNFTFSSSTNKLTITNASTSNLTASYASTSNLTVSTGFFFGSASGILKAVAGVVSAALVNLASDVTGILPVANGGTGWSSLAAGAIPYGNGSSALATTSSGTPGYVLALLNGVPTWTATTTLANISGTLGVGSGGTGATTFGQGWIYSSGSTSALAASTSPTVNYITATSTTATSTFRGGAVFALGGGNVVIGTTTANHEFDVWQLNNTAIGLTTTDPALTVTNGGSTVGNGSTVAFQGVDSVGTEVTLARISDISTALTAGAASGNLAFFTRNAGTQQQDLTILAAGNVGIGTTTPGSLLSVQGVANWTGATSTLYSTGGINLTAGCFSIQGTCLPTGGPFAALTVPTSGASFTGSISGTTLTVTAVASGTIYPGQQILGSGISTITTVYVDDSGTGGTGTYTLTVSYGTIASESMSTVSSDVFAGPYAGNTSAGGTSDTALGFLAGSSLTTPASPSTANPQNDTFLGFGAGADCTTCRETTAIGAMAGNALTGSGGGVEDSLDTFVGSYAGVNTVEPAINDTFVGQKAGSGNTTGSDNTYVGVHSSIYDATSSNNTYVGYATSNGGADAGANVLVGSQAGTNFGRCLVASSLELSL
jgi:hypothetical protein